MPLVRHITMVDGKGFDLLNSHIMRSIIVTLLLFCILAANAQNNRLWGGVEVGYGYSLAEKKMFMVSLILRTTLFHPYKLFWAIM